MLYFELPCCSIFECHEKADCEIKCRHFGKMNKLKKRREEFSTKNSHSKTNVVVSAQCARVDAKSGYGRECYITRVTKRDCVT